MSVEGPVPSPRPAAARLIAALCAALLCGCRGDGAPYVLLSEAAPDAHHTAVVRLIRCGTEWCESLWLGATPDSATLVATLPHAAERCTEIAWTSDGRRAAFLINGAQLRVYDAQTNAPAGLIDLVASPRIARGITFSDNGAAITFDDCPGDRSGCRPGLVAIR